MEKKKEPKYRYVMSDYHKTAISLSKIGHVVTEETKKKMSETNKNLVFTDEHRKKIALGKTGKPGYWRGKKRPELTGENSHLWKGGIARSAYPIEFSKVLKQEVRLRDGFLCQICKAPKSIEVHHIDYVKENCAKSNLITLCKSCHAKTNTRREYWINYFSGFTNLLTK